ncbi:hypothetical protein D9757_012451 [Collybiopsis confluens]|uniref:Uncharacterized protein n=1 Tax=Collybiopsis confluens TaxID=2823264 RepID=A0A8H5D4T7_9AGAR|nr:hypothetical protein D9757_012451 [Collybiopsis confluens]
MDTSIGRREEMIGILKNKLAGAAEVVDDEEEEEEVLVVEPRTTRSTRTSGVNGSVKKSSGTSAAAQESVSAPPRSSRKRKIENDEAKSIDAKQKNLSSNAGKRTRASRREHDDKDVAVADEMDVDASISASPRRGKRTAALASSLSVELGDEDAEGSIDEEYEAEQKPKKRGRKHVEEPADVTDRRRGRPRKQPVEEEPKDEFPAEVSRGRGRHRKRPVGEGEVESEDGPPAEVRKGRGRPRKQPAEEVSEGDELPSKRVTRASISAPVPQTPPAKRARVSPPPFPRLTGNSLRPPHSTRSRTGGSPVKKQTYLTAPLVKRTYANARKGSRATSIASSVGMSRPIRKPRLSVSKLQPVASIKKSVSRPHRKAVSARPKRQSDISDAGASGSSRKFDGVELILPRKRQNVVAVNGDEAGSSNASGAIVNAGDANGAQSSDADGDGESDIDVLGDDKEDEISNVNDDNMSIQDPPPVQSEAVPTLSSSQTQSQPAALGIESEIDQEETPTLQQLDSLFSQPGSEQAIDEADQEEPPTLQQPEPPVSQPGSEQGIDEADQQEPFTLQQPEPPVQPESGQEEPSSSSSSAAPQQPAVSSSDPESAAGIQSGQGSISIEQPEQPPVTPSPPAPRIERAASLEQELSEHDAPMSETPHAGTPPGIQVQGETLSEVTEMHHSMGDDRYSPEDENESEIEPVSKGTMDVPSSAFEEVDGDLIQEAVQGQRDLVFEGQINVSVVPIDQNAYNDDQDAGDDNEGDDYSHFADAGSSSSQYVSVLPRTEPDVGKNKNSVTDVQGDLATEASAAILGEEPEVYQIDDDDDDDNNGVDIMNPRMSIEIEIGIQQDVLVVNDDGEQEQEQELEQESVPVPGLRSPSASGEQYQSPWSTAADSSASTTSATVELVENDPNDPFAGFASPIVIPPSPLPPSGLDLGFSTSPSLTSDFTKASIDSLRSLNSRPIPSDAADNEMFENTWTDDEDASSVVNESVVSAGDEDVHVGVLSHARYSDSWLNVGGSTGAASASASGDAR